MTFEHLARLNVADKTAWFDLPPELGEGARIQGKPANDATPAYFNNLTHRQGKQIRNLSNGKTLTSKDLKELRENDRTLYPRYIITAWEGITDKNGKLVPFIPDEVKDFFANCPDWLLDEIRAFFSKAHSFIDDAPGVDLPDAEILSGNSQGGSSGS